MDIPSEYFFKYTESKGYKEPLESSRKTPLWHSNMEQVPVPGPVCDGSCYLGQLQGDEECLWFFLVAVVSAPVLCHLLLSLEDKLPTLSKLKMSFFCF